ncbi:hypothetical protein [Flavivirga spongiicola]|uniref:Uncharacterized protein n=1 Tax=Flavivirga spongiicola TaxID=421621 RepID=A0ABU7XTZ4_9FLAO|nr:hypothetical protein [Flavivirga sp. MEBiC05379]MDO5979251.1 hypothetical protein [Flavivirga sp. MEBiC05379]
MKNLARLICMGILLASTVTSCTKTDLETDNMEEVNPQSTEGGDEKIKALPTGG